MEGERKWLKDGNGRCGDEWRVEVRGGRETRQPQLDAKQRVAK